MAKKRGVRITIVVEDEALERFARAVLWQFGFSTRELRSIPYPVGRGSAKDWVDKQYPVEVRVLRSKAYQKVGLLVGTDADEGTLAHRFQRLSESLKAHGVAARADGERIVVWVPKWNVETWILHLMGDTRDEDHDFRHDCKRPEFAHVASAFVDEYRRFTRDDTLETLPSLKTAYDETARLEL